LETKIRSLKQNDADEITRYESILTNLRSLRADSRVLQQEGIADIQTQANLILEQIFPNQALKVVASDSDGPISVDLLGDEFAIEMGAVNGSTFPLQKQGSGTQRTALWAILKLLADRGVKAKAAAKSAKAFHEPVGPNVAHILLIDEPEVSLHPKATQHARDVLYALPNTGNWQVMITTHSPSFIDLTKDHTTIVRVEKNAQNGIEATTLYRPEVARLDADDKENLKLLNLFDSHISEAFFGGKVVVVEGDTEYSAFNFIRGREVERGNSFYKDLNVIRARGKVQVASMMKVLNHFKAKYFVLHDTDRPSTQSRVLDRAASVQDRKVYRTKIIANPAWSNNRKIIDNRSEQSRVVASIINFEEAYFAEVVEKEKPESCIEHLKADPNAYDVIKQLLDGLLQVEGIPLPPGAIVYETLDDLGAAVAAWDSQNILD
jgi:putative ATP-dependent endonuclease of OLD family